MLQNNHLQPITPQKILHALSHVDDPDLKQDLVTLKMIENIEIQDLNVSFTLILTTPACPLKEQIKNACINAIKHLVHPQAQVNVHITARVTTQRTNQETILPNVKNIIVVASGKGGVGKSTVATNLAVALAQAGAQVGLIDADIHGPSIPTMLNLKNETPQIVNINNQPKILPLQKYGLKIMSIGFLAAANQAIVWRGPMVSSALRQFVADTHWESLDYLILDLPPGTGDVQLTLAQLLPITAAIIVTTPQAVAQADVIKAIAMFQLPQINVPILGIVENMSYFTPPELPENKYYIFGKNGGIQLAQTYNVPLLAQLPITEAITEGGDTGVPVVLEQPQGIAAKSFIKLSENVARYIAIQNAPPQSTTHA